MLLWSGELIFPLLCSIFKFYRSGNNEKVFNNCSYTGKCENKKRLGLFVHYDKKNIISDI